MNHQETSFVDAVNATVVLSSGFFSNTQKLRHFLKVLLPIKDLMKNFFLLSLALVAVITLLYAGFNGLVKDHSYGPFFTFIGAITTIGLGIDVVNHLKIHIRKNKVRKLGGF
jgi:hypothetical protein